MRKVRKRKTLHGTGSLNRLKRDPLRTPWTFRWGKLLTKWSSLRGLVPVNMALGRSLVTFKWWCLKLRHSSQYSIDFRARVRQGCWIQGGGGGVFWNEKQVTGEKTMKGEGVWMEKRKIWRKGKKCHQLKGRQRKGRTAMTEGLRAIKEGEREPWIKVWTMNEEMSHKGRRENHEGRGSE